MTALTKGDAAPTFTLLDADKKPVTPADYANSHVILYFFPAAMTPGCTIEAIDFGAALDDFTAAGYHIIGVSPDTPEKLARFRDKESIKFTLLSDPDKEVIKAYDAYGSKVLYGKRVEGVIRTTFVIDVDPQGKATITEAQYNVRASGHVQRLRKDLGLDKP